VLHFDNSFTQNWLMVRLPQPALPDQPTKLPVIDRTPPPVTSAKTQNS
jgi:hypothetical protein